MARMLGKTVHDRYLKIWCCPGHDGTWKQRIKAERSSQRAREEKEWRGCWQENTVSDSTASEHTAVTTGGLLEDI